jgi:hypothetical protein
MILHYVINLEETSYCKHINTILSALPSMLAMLLDMTMTDNIT